jgi:hypothetical protein
MQFIRGEAFQEKEPQPDVMAIGVKCTECHTTISQGHSLVEVKKTCVQCHEDRYGKMTDEWQQEIAGRTKKLELSLETLKVQRKAVPDPEKKMVEALTKEAEDLLKAVGEDKSKGVHNFAYAQKLVAEAEEKVLSVKRRLSK